MPTIKTRKKLKTAELGGSGTTVYDGVVYDVEYNSDFNTEYNGNGLTIIDRMRKSDPVVRASLRIVKLGILQAEWYIESASDDPRDEEIKEFVSDAIFEKMSRSWDETLSDMLTYLDFGFYVGEKVYKIEDGKVYIDKIAFRTQKSIVKFETSDNKWGIEQMLMGRKEGKGKMERVSIPGEKMILLTNEQEGDNYRGVSLLRAAYKPFFYKENYEKIDAIGFERQAVGVPVFTMPKSPKANDVDKAKEIGENLRANEKAYVVLPSGWTLEILNMKAGTVRTADDAIKRFDRAILMNVLAQFMELGSGSTGSKALSNDHSTIFYRSLQYSGDLVASAVNTGVIKELVDLNYDNVKKYPKLRVTGIEDIDAEVFMEAVTSGVDSNVLTSDDDLEDFVRKQIRLPKRSKDAVAREKKEKKVDPKIDPEEDPKKEKKLPVKTSLHRGKKYANGPFWRELTFAEEKINLTGIQRRMDQLEGQIEADIVRVMTPEVDSIMRDVKTAIQSGDIKRVEDIAIKFQASARQLVLDHLQSSFDSGKLQAANEINVLAPKTTLDDINYITTKANVISKKITDDLLNQAKLETMSHMRLKTPTDEAIDSISSTLTGKIADGSKLAASVVTSGGINSGRDSVFKQNPEKIYALQRSEILDTHICNYCLSVDGRVVELSDPITKFEQFHFLCRGIWVSIGVDEAEKPDIGGIPDDLREQIGTLNEFEQIKKPDTLPGSLAEEEAIRQQRK